MGCINCKSQVSEQTTPFTLKKQSRWRFIVGIEARGLEFNAQVGPVHVGDEKYDRAQVIEKPLEEENHPIEPPPGNLDPYDTVR